MSSSGDKEPFRVLFVCMGNICRSPMAEALCRSLSRQFAPAILVEAASAGTHDLLTGRPPDPRAQRVARQHGLDISRQRARQLVQEDFERFDLVLAMDRRNYGAARKLARGSARDRLRMLVDFSPPPRPLEIPDPYFGTDEDFEHVFESTRHAVEGLLLALAKQSTCS